MQVRDTSSPPPTTHEWSGTFTRLLGDVIAGEAAREVAAQLRAEGHPPEHRSGVSVTVLPSFVDLAPAIPLGRKQRSRDGMTPLLFPTRVVWDGGPVRVLADDQSESVGWELVGLGNQLAGTTAIDATHGPGRPVASDGVPAWVRAEPVGTARRARQRLDEIGERGSLARWEVRQLLERQAAWVLGRAHAAVANEITDGAVSAILDGTELEALLDEMLLGDADRRISPAIDRLIDRCLAPAAFARVDPQRLVVVALRSAAETALRRSVGDPHIGRKIRALARSAPGLDPEQFLALYRETFPADAAGLSRITAALAVGNRRPHVLVGDDDELALVGARGVQR